ncbi:MAG: hypothetical protein IKJ77_10050 [Firmicutes bacterium]|nr:hypothetical protein [Bacillota bacterium]
MKKKKRTAVRLLVTLIVICAAMTCTAWAIPEEGPLVQMPDPKLENAVDEVIFVPEKDGFQMKFKVQTGYYEKNNLPEYDTIDCANYLIQDENGQLIAKKQVPVDMKAFWNSFENVCEERLLKPGETITLYFDLASSGDGQQGNTAATLYDWNGNPIGFKSITVTVPSVEELIYAHDVKVVRKEFRTAYLQWSYTSYTDYRYIDVEGFKIDCLNEEGTKVLQTNWYESPITTNMGEDEFEYGITVPLNKKYKVRITPYYLEKGEKQFTGSSELITVTSSNVKAPKASVTKISNKKVRITITKAENATGTIVYQKVNGIWKKLGSTTGTKYTVTKNTAGKKSYKFKSYTKHDGKTYYSGYSGVYTPKVNVKKYDPIYDAKEYANKKSWVEPVKVYYDHGKIKVRALFINNNKYKVNDFKYKITVKADGKTIGSRTINAGPIKKQSYVIKTFTLKNCKTGADLRNGNVKFIRKKVDVSR